MRSQLLAYRSSLARAVSILLGLGAASCASEPAPSAQVENLTQIVGDVEALFTAPYCDVCTSADKDVLLANSEMIARTVSLIDGATHQIDVAQFTFSRKEIEEALLRAHARGIGIRIAMDSGQDRDGSASRRLKESGLDVQFVKGKAAGDRFGLMHAKFMLVDRATLMMGSNNWSSTGTSINNENAIVMKLSATDPRIAAFQCQFDAIYAGATDRAGQCSTEDVGMTPSTAPFKMIRDRIRAAQTSVDVLMHHLTYDKLVKELAKAAENGIRVRVIVNAEDRGEHSGADWDRLIAAGGQIRYKQTNAEAFQFMHHKLAIIDDRELLNGTGNWSGSAFFNNFEAFVRLDDPRVVQPFRGMFYRLWNWSLSGAALDAGQSAMEQHAAVNRTYFGNLHAHFVATEGEQLLDDGTAEQRDEAGETVSIEVPSTVGESTRYALSQARDFGGLDFMALTPHCKDDADGDPHNEPNMSQAGFETLTRVAAEISAESGGSFLGLAGMEWSSNSAGNHVGILGSRELSKVERGRFDTLYNEYLPSRALAGDRPILMLNHPKTFALEEETLSGAWDQIYGVNLLDIPKAGERRQKFNDYGLDDFAPLKDVLPAWLDGTALPDSSVVAATLANIQHATAPYAHLMEVTLGRGTEFGDHSGQNPSLVEDEEGNIVRRTKVHTDYDYYLLHGFALAPVANHDNHMANWGSGHSSRTGVIAPELTEEELMTAFEQRAVFASEDQNLSLGFYVERRVSMGGMTKTPHSSVMAHIQLSDPDYDGPYSITVYGGVVGGGEVTPVGQWPQQAAGWLEVSLPVAEPGRHFFYVEVLEDTANRMAWSAPIWIDRL